jgi:hypothetical protein
MLKVKDIAEAAMKEREKLQIVLIKGFMVFLKGGGQCKEYTLFHRQEVPRQAKTL